MSDLTKSTSQWIKFFKDAGLPINVSANYAIIFADNRIQLDMLMDLSKEYLYDMGIRVMGDVIAILKHAKEYHTELAKEKMMATIDSPQQKKSSPATRMLGHLTKSPLLPLPVTSRLSRPSAVPPFTQATKRPHVNVNSPVISLRTSNNKYVSPPSAKKIRRVLSDDEGAYRIKMPSGNTERSRQILKKRQQLLQLKKRATVFDRLGDSAVSSTTDIEKSKVTSSVFDRLGSNNDVSTSTISSNSGKLISLSSQPLQYQGVLKKTSVKINTTPTKIVWDKSPTKITESGLKRTVYNSTVELRASNVRKINEILVQNATVKTSSPNKSNIVVTRRLLGNGRMANKPVLQRLGPKSGMLQLKRKTEISSRVGLRIGAQKQKTVFDRLGK